LDRCCDVEVGAAELKPVDKAEVGLPRTVPDVDWAARIDGQLDKFRAGFALYSVSVNSRDQV
jgi:hypothetical protein